MGELVEDIGEPGFGVDAVEPGGLESGVDDGGAFAALFGAEEQEVLAGDGDTAKRAFGDVVIDGELPVSGEPGERVPAAEGVLQRLGEVGLARDVLPEIAASLS